MTVPVKKAVLFPSMVFVLVENAPFSKPVDELRALIEENGGKVQATATAKVNYVLCARDDTLKTCKQIKAALKNGLAIVTEQFLFESVEKGRLAEIKHFRTWPEEEPSTADAAATTSTGRACAAGGHCA